MIDRGSTSLLDAHRSGTALTAFTTYSIESSVAVCAAAAEVGVPTILQASPGCFVDVGRTVLLRTMLAAAAECPVAIGVHLDHATGLEEITAALELGCTSVMIDGSALSFDDNVELTRAAVRLAREAHAWIEGELGGVPGQEDLSVTVATGSYTDPTAAAAFIHQTGVDALAVAIGNLHGMAAQSPTLDLDRLRAIRSATPVPLVLHGASGVSPADLRAAVEEGVAKINVNTELRRAHLGALREPIDGDDIRQVRRAAIEAMREVAVRNIRLLGGKAS